MTAVLSRSMCVEQGTSIHVHVVEMQSRLERKFRCRVRCAGTVVLNSPKWHVLLLSFSLSLSFSSPLDLLLSPPLAASAS